MRNHICGTWIHKTNDIFSNIVTTLTLQLFRIACEIVNMQFSVCLECKELMLWTVGYVRSGKDTQEFFIVLTNSLKKHSAATILVILPWTYSQNPLTSLGNNIIFKYWFSHIICISKRFNELENSFQIISFSQFSIFRSAKPISTLVRWSMTSDFPAWQVNFHITCPGWQLGFFDINTYLHKLTYI